MSEISDGASVRDDATGDMFGAPFQGVCDGCESGEPQIVRTVHGHWGAATVCPFHETHV